MPLRSSRNLSTANTGSDVPVTQFDLSNARQLDAYLATDALPHERHVLRPTLFTSSLSRSGGLLQGQSQHTLSISHPFPSILGSSRKLDKRPDGKAIESPDKMQEGGPLSSSMPLPKSFSNKGPSHAAELRTGNCATCDSTVRWPRHLGVYRCTACLMINDLQPSPALDNSPASINLFHRASDKPPLYQVRRKVLPLSLEKIESLIDQEITTFLHEEASFLKTNKTYSAGRGYTGQSKARLEQNCGDGKDYKSQQERLISREGNKWELEPSQSTPVDQSGRVDLPDFSFQSSIPFRQSSQIASAIVPLLSPSTEGSRHVSFSPTTRGDLCPDARAPVFRQLEAYLITSLKHCDCLNASFMVERPEPARASSETSISTGKTSKSDSPGDHDNALFEVDAKTLLLGDIGENGLWWTGGRRHSQNKAKRDSNKTNTTSDRKHLRFDWDAINQWYDVVLSCGRSWKAHYLQLPPEDRRLSLPEELKIDDFLADAQVHVQRTFLKAIENLLRRPGRALKAQEDYRFLLILLLNPLLYPQQIVPANGKSKTESQQSTKHLPMSAISSASSRDFTSQILPRGGATGQHSSIIKRILGLIGNLSSESHQVFVSWFCRVPEIQFREMAELIGGFVSYRLSRQHGRKPSNTHDPTAGLIPNISGPGAGTSAHLHAAIGTSGRSANKEIKKNMVTYEDDWQLRAAAKVMSLLFSANVHGRASRSEGHRNLVQPKEQAVPVAAQQRAQRHGQLLPTSAFYNTLLDHTDLIADYENWESRRGKFSFCQYPMFLSIWAKIRIMEYDARRQMEVKARDAFFTSILSRKAVSQYLLLKVRRDCLVDDSLRGVSEVVGSGQEEVKKGLRIEFLGEEGVDAGGLRKEWFLLLVREVFDPDHGLFVYDEDSHYCYFNPHSFETSDQFFLVGVVLGLAIYNSTILDVALPPFTFRKLLASAPHHTGPSITVPRVSSAYTLDDLAEWKPSLARGLRQLLEYEGDVQETFCRDFVVDVDRYGQIIQLPLCSNGEKRPVTNSSRKEFVDLYVRYMLDTAVMRQFEPFKRGFFTVCGGNALSLFRPEEIELLVRGSDEPLDVTSLRAVAVYDNWGTSATNGLEASAVRWFWESFDGANTEYQQKLLTFITGSDRIPAMGTTSLVIKVVCLGDDYSRYPTARTCFNMLGLYNYRSKPELESKLWRAVLDSEGFGLK